MNLQYYRRQMVKSVIIIILLVLFALFSTYYIYNKFAKERDHDVDTGRLEVSYHNKNSNHIDLVKFTPVSDSVGLSMPSYDFTVTNNTQEKVNYKIILEVDHEKIQLDGCGVNQIPNELLKLSFRKDSRAPFSLILSEYKDNVLFTDSLKALDKEEYSIRIWAVNSDFIIDKNSHFHAKIKVVEGE